MTDAPEDATDESRENPVAAATTVTDDGKHACRDCGSTDFWRGERTIDDGWLDEDGLFHVERTQTAETTNLECAECGKRIY